MDRLRNPRVLQALGAGVILLGFVAGWRPVAVLALLALAMAYAVFAENVRMYRNTWATEVILLVLSDILFLAGRAGWAWVLALLAAGVAAMAAIADVWVMPETGAGQVRKPK